jgi:hypothetical protein
MRKYACIWLVAAMFLSVGLAAASDNEKRIIIGQITSLSDDGQITTREVIYDPSSRSFRPLGSDVLKSIFPADRSWSSAVAYACSRWNAKVNGKVVLSITEDMAPHKKAFNKVMRKYHNKLRGTKSMPTLAFDARSFKVKDISEFQDPYDYYEQFWWDGSNLIWLTDDDQWFKNTTGNSWLYGENTIQFTITFLKSVLKNVSGRWVTDQYIVEVHVYLRSNFFNIPKPLYTQSAVRAFAAAMGYRATVWAHDLNKNGFTVFATESEILNKGSDVWTKINEPRDMFYYEDKPAGVPAAYLSTPRLLPFEGEVLDLGGYEVPSTDESNPEPLLPTSSVFLTNLKAFDGKKKLSADIDWLQTLPDNSTQWVVLAKLSGNLYDYPWTITINGQPQKVYPTVFGNMIFIGRQQDLDTMKDAVRDHGTPQTIDGKYFAKALRIRAKVTGRLTETGGQKSLTQEYWLIDTDANPLQ